METSIYAISSALISATVGNESLMTMVYNAYRKYKYKSRVFGLILFKGVSHLCDHLKGQDIIFIDLDRLYQNLNLKEPTDKTEISGTENLLSYHIIKNHILNILTIYKKKVVLVSKDYELMKCMPVKDYNIYFSCFSKEADENLKSIYSNEKEHSESVINKFRLLRLNEIKEQNIIYCNSLKEMYDKLIILFQLPKVNL